MIDVSCDGNEYKVILTLTERGSFFIKNTSNSLDLSVYLDTFVLRVVA